MTIRYVTVERVLWVHAMVRAAGVRDQAGLESAVHSPRQLAAYVDADLSELAAAYLFGLVRNHPFVDGNKRTAWVVMKLFLTRNGARLPVPTDDAVAFMERLGAGGIARLDVARWIRERIR